MNIFVISPDPVVCAQMLDNRRLVKMVLETAQLLCNVIRDRDPENPSLYRATHANHPCTLWLKQDERHVSWTIRLFFELCREYSYRYGKTHQCEQKLGELFKYHYNDLPDPELWCNCSMFKELSGNYPDNVFAAYSQTMKLKWLSDTEDGRPPQWSPRAKPWWYP